MGPLRALETGIRYALRYWPAWLALWVATWLAALPLAIFPALALWQVAHTPVAADLAAGVRASHLLDVARLAMNAVTIPDQPLPLASELSSSLSGLAVLPLALPLLGSLVSAFTWGGLLLTYAEAPAPFRLSRFLWGGWRWFGSFLLLALVQAVLFGVVFGLMLGLGWLFAQLGTVALWLWLILLLGLAGFWLTVFELARVQAVVTRTRNPFLALARAFRLAFDRPLLLAIYTFLALLVLLAVHLLFRRLLLPALPLDALLLAVMVQQGFILARLLARALRVAGLVAIAQSAVADGLFGPLAVEGQPAASLGSNPLLAEEGGRARLYPAADWPVSKPHDDEN